MTEQIAPLFVGEWGTCYTNAKCVSEQSAWMECFTSFLKDNDMDWFYWYVSFCLFFKIEEENSKKKNNIE